MDPLAISEIPGKSDSPELKIDTGFYETVYPLIEDLCIKNNGTIEDAKDLFQDGLLVVIKKSRNDNFKLDCKLTTYLYSIYKNIWYNELKRRRIRKNNYSTIIKEYEPEEIMTADERIEERKLELFQKHFNNLSCSKKEILNLCFDGKTTAEIMESAGIRTRNYALKKIYKCKKKLFNKIVSDLHYLRLADNIMRFH